MTALLTSWQCDLYPCQNETEAQNIPFEPRIMLADYQLDHVLTGLDVMTGIRERMNNPDIPGILITADPRPEIADQAKALGFYFLSKPVRPAALRALMRRLLS